jgi:folate-binding protein YgfZ
VVIATADYELLTTAAGAVVREGRAIVELTGSEAAEFLQGQVSNDVEGLTAGHGCYATLLDHKGKLRTDLRVLRLAEDHLLIDAEGIGLPVLLHVFQTFSLGRDVRTRDLTPERSPIVDGASTAVQLSSEQRVLVSLIGPAARALLEDPPALEEHAFTESELGLAVATDLGVDLIVALEQLDQALALAPAASEEAAECVRIESGRPRLGLDMGSTTIPQEAGINERAVNFEKGCYVGQETVARLHWRGKPNRHLRGLRLSETAPRGATITYGEREVGTVGSTCVSPALGPIALALVRREASPGEEVTVDGAPAAVVDLPFTRVD